jgi:hypothetical protein
MTAVARRHKRHRETQDDIKAGKQLRLCLHTPLCGGRTTETDLVQSNEDPTPFIVEMPIRAFAESAVLPDVVDKEENLFLERLPSGVLLTENKSYTSGTPLTQRAPQCCQIKGIPTIKSKGNQLLISSKDQRHSWL